MTITKAQPNSKETVDVERLSHLNAHPELRPLFDQRAEIRQRLQDIERDIKSQHLVLVAVRDDSGVSGVGARREAEDRLAALEREAAASEAALCAVQRELETAQDAVKGQLTPLLAREGLPLAAELLDVLERLAEVAPRFAAYDQRAHRMLGKSLAALPWAGTALDAYTKQVQKIHERLVHLSEQ